MQGSRGRGDLRSWVGFLKPHGRFELRCRYKFGVKGQGVVDGLKGLFLAVKSQKRHSHVNVVFGIGVAGIWVWRA